MSLPLLSLKLFGDIAARGKLVYQPTRIKNAQVEIETTAGTDPRL